MLTAGEDLGLGLESNSPSLTGLESISSLSSMGEGWPTPTPSQEGLVSGGLPSAESLSKIFSEGKVPKLRLNGSVPDPTEDWLLGHLLGTDFPLPQLGEALLAGPDSLLSCLFKILPLEVFLTHFQETPALKTLLFLKALYVVSGGGTDVKTGVIVGLIKTRMGDALLKGPLGVDLEGIDLDQVVPTPLPPFPEGPPHRRSLLLLGGGSLLLGGSLVASTWMGALWTNPSFCYGLMGLDPLVTSLAQGSSSLVSTLHSSGMVEALQTRGPRLLEESQELRQLQASLPTLFSFVRWVGRTFPGGAQTD